MFSARAEFERRVSEIEEYIDYLERLEKLGGISVTLMNTMKSSALLMMYNLVESTMTNAMQDIFDHIKSTNTDFNSLTDKMKEVVLNMTRKRSAADVVKKMSEDAMTLAVACFDRIGLFSGNIDTRKISDTARDIGLKPKKGYSEAALLTIKDERNNLAHGTKSFSDCGKDYAATDLRYSYEKVKALLLKVILDFEVYLQNKSYR
nr:MAE_28990/MAE_18760 family HEPN-like nuclease [uncultured Massilia sp.]